jgi:hypothetical protein
MEHISISDVCTGCHYGCIAPGKPAIHPQTATDCGDCHTTLTWGAVTVDRTSITTQCIHCHNGHTAERKPADHIPAPYGCDRTKRVHILPGLPVGFFYHNFSFPIA